MKNLLLSLVAGLTACASIVNDSHVPITLSFSDNSAGTCDLKNEREEYQVTMPSTVSVRRSDDALVFKCFTTDGREARGSIPSEIGGTIVGNIILGGGIGAIIDASNDKDRTYPEAFIIPVAKAL